MNKATARALEALIGVGAGGSLGGAAGALTYRPDSPREWMNEYGEVEARRLTASERKDRRKRALVAALVGGGVGGSGSLGASAFRRGRLSKADRELVEGEVSSVLRPLRDFRARAEKRLQGVERTPRGATSSTARQLRERLRAISQVEEEQSKALRGLIRKADDARASRLYGGVNWANRAGEKVDFYRDSYLDQTDRHLQALAKKHKADRYGLQNRNSILDAEIRSKMSKTAQEAFRRELSALLGEV
jgi:hypothetical protein